MSGGCPGRSGAGTADPHITRTPSFLRTLFVIPAQAGIQKREEHPVESTHGNHHNLP